MRQDDGIKGKALADWARAELTENILPFWRTYGRHEVSGGYYGVLDNRNVGDAEADRSVVMTARHLWTYSAAALFLGRREYLEDAGYAYRALVGAFYDADQGGYFWSAAADGSPVVVKKQIYGQAFALYGLAEYAAALAAHGGGDGDAGEASAVLSRALELYGLLEDRARDRLHGGYFEARGRDWSATADLKLSDADVDCDKSMNTNLHVLEALTALHRTVRLLRPRDAALSSAVGESLSSLIEVTMDRILGADGHLDLYFSADWLPAGDRISFGHDIEASWLLWEAAEELAQKAAQKAAQEAAQEAAQGGAPGPLLERARRASVRMAEVALAEGFEPSDACGGAEPLPPALANEVSGPHRDRTRVWWCQAEALVGFLNAHGLTGDRRFLDAAAGVRDWIDACQKDRAGGDWFAQVSAAGVPDLSEPKGGNWKTGYHNGRCCLEILTRMG